MFPYIAGPFLGWGPVGIKNVQLKLFDQIVYGYAVFHTVDVVGL